MTEPRKPDQDQHDKTKERKVFSVRLSSRLIAEIKQLADDAGWSMERLARYAFLRVLDEPDETIAQARHVQEGMKKLEQRVAQRGKRKS